MIIEFLGKFYDNHSLSIVNRNIAVNLADIPGVVLKITALDSYDSAYKLDKTVVKKLKQLEKTEIDKPEIQLRHSYPPVWLWPEHKDTKVVFIQPWEFSKVPMEWQYKFETFADALIVPSNYVKTVFLNGGINPADIFTVPNGYNETLFNREPSNIDVSKYNINKDKFNFVYVGNSQWRKNIATLLEVWSKTFKKYDNARLIIKDNPNIYGKTNILSEIIKLQYKTECADIIYIDDDLSDEEIAAVYKASKVVIHPYRAEGFGMHIQEAVACGCLPIVPEKGPTEDFIPKDIGFRIPVNSVHININDPSIFATKPGDAMTLMGTHSLVNDPNPNALQQIMLYIYSAHNKQELLDKVKQLEMPNTWASVATNYHAVLKNIANRQIIKRKAI